MSVSISSSCQAEEERKRELTTVKVDMAWRPFGSLAGTRTRLSLTNAPQAFKASDEILIQFTDLEKSVKIRGHQKASCKDGVQVYVLDLECADRIPSGDLNATLVTCEEECVFSGEMTVEGKPKFRLPFDDKHWYCIKASDGTFMGLSTDSVNEPFFKKKDPHPASHQFRFLDTGKGDREFYIYLGHHPDRLVTNHHDYAWHLTQHHKAPSFGNHNWHIWTVEEAGSSYLIKSKKDGNVIRDCGGQLKPGDLLLGFGFDFTVKDASGDKKEKFTFRQMSRI